jgi:hypothetical protein
MRVSTVNQLATGVLIVRNLGIGLVDLFRRPKAYKTALIKHLSEVKCLISTWGTSRRACPRRDPIG